MAKVEVKDKETAPEEPVQTEQKEESNDSKPSELETLQREKHDLISTLQHLQAEFENFRKRTERENAQMKDRMEASFIEKLLPVLDAFDGALKSDDEGVKALYSVLIDILKAQGLATMEAKGQPFDHSKHEVMLMQEDDGDENMVLDIVQPGYMFKDKVLRYAKVVVSKKKEADNSAEK